jgi:hypothetical protein
VLLAVHDDAWVAMFGSIFSQEVNMMPAIFLLIQITCSNCISALAEVGAAVVTRCTESVVIRALGPT